MPRSESELSAVSCWTSRAAKLQLVMPPEKRRDTMRGINQLDCTSMSEVSPGPEDHSVYMQKSCNWRSFWSPVGLMKRHWSRRFSVIVTGSREKPHKMPTCTAATDLNWSMSFWLQCQDHQNHFSFLASQGFRRKALTRNCSDGCRVWILWS